MSIAEKTTRKETTQNNPRFIYNSISTKNELFDEIKVLITFEFDIYKKTSFPGPLNEIRDNDKPKQEALSFYDAAIKAWIERFSRDTQHQVFAKAKLLEKWAELHGEDLTGKKLEF